MRRINNHGEFNKRRKHIQLLSDFLVPKYVTEKDMMLVLSLPSMREIMEGLYHCYYELDDSGRAMIENQGKKTACSTPSACSVLKHTSLHSR